MGTGEVHIGFCCGNLRERHYLEDVGVDERMILKCVRRKSVGMAWSGLIGLRIGTIQVAGS